MNFWKYLCRVTAWLNYLFNICPFKQLKWPKSIKRSLKFCQMINKPKRNGERLLKFGQKFAKSGHTDR